MSFLFQTLLIEKYFLGMIEILGIFWAYFIRNLKFRKIYNKLNDEKQWKYIYQWNSWLLLILILTLVRADDSRSSVVACCSCMWRCFDLLVCDDSWASVVACCSCMWRCFNLLVCDDSWTSDVAALVCDDASIFLNESWVVWEVWVDLYMMISGDGFRT